MVAQNNTMRGPTNYYRTSDIRNEEEEDREFDFNGLIAFLTLYMFHRRTSQEKLESSCRGTSSLP